MRKCTRCHDEMKENCYIQDSAQPISDLTLIEKNENLKKKEYSLKAALCKRCGYVELYVDVKED